MYTPTPLAIVTTWRVVAGCMLLAFPWKRNARFRLQNSPLKFDFHVSHSLLPDLNGAARCGNSQDPVLIKIPNLHASRENMVSLNGTEIIKGDENVVVDLAAFFWIHLRVSFDQRWCHETSQVRTKYWYARSLVLILCQRCYWNETLKQNVRIPRQS